MRFYNREKLLEVWQNWKQSARRRLVWLEAEMKRYRTEYRLLSLEDVLD